MKLGFFVTNQYLPGESMPQKIQDSAEQVRAARDAGFSLIATGEHYLAAPYQMSTSLTLLSRLAADAGDMQVAATVILVPLHNPVELAESIATLDAITNGKFVFGVGLGYRDEEYTAFGVQKGERVGRFNEAMDLIKRLWSEEEIEFNGKYYTVPKTKISTRPVQSPPPIWVAANNDVAIRRAARWGYPWLINPHATVPMVADQWHRYKAALDEFGNPVGPAEIRVTAIGGTVERVVNTGEEIVPASSLTFMTDHNGVAIYELSSSGTNVVSVVVSAVGAAGSGSNGAARSGAAVASTAAVAARADAYASIPCCC